MFYLHPIAVQHYWSERGKREEDRRQLSYLWVFREPHWGNLHNEIQVFIHMICSCQDTPTLPAPCCVPQWNCSHSDCSLHPISEVKQAHKNQILLWNRLKQFNKVFINFKYLYLNSSIFACNSIQLTIWWIVNLQYHNQSHVTVMWCLKSVWTKLKTTKCHVVIMWTPLMNYCITHYLNTGDLHVTTSWIVSAKRSLMSWQPCEQLLADVIAALCWSLASGDT